MKDTKQLFDWLVDGAHGASDASEVIGRVGDDLVRAGIPVDRIAAFVRTLHPHLMGRSFTWKRGEGVRVGEASYDFVQTAEFQSSPITMVYRTRKALRRRLTDESARGEFADLDDLAAQGFTDYLLRPITFLSGEVHVVSFATKDPAGFTGAHLAAFDDLMRPLARIAEIMALRRTAVTLLNTYVGRNAGERILAGQIHLGDLETIRAVLWFSDLRGFTALAGALEPSALIRALNELFGAQVTAIDRHGGEVLKFMGDGLLAIFPFDHGGTVPKPPRAPGDLCDAALDAAGEAFAAVAALTEVRAARGEPPLRFGLALHVGDVAYGNIGGQRRLDFTCIGPAVNVASRLEGLTGQLGRPVVVSPEFAALTKRPMASLGTFELKGVTVPQPVFAPEEGQPLSAW